MKSQGSEGIIHGNPMYTLLTFAVPIVLGNIFQQLYSVVDAVVVGQYLGDLPLGAISVASPLIDIVNALLIGSTIGIGVLLARLYGAMEFELIRTTHATVLLLGVLIALALAVLGSTTAGSILRMQGTEEAVCRAAVSYLRVLFAGLPLNFLYLYYAALLRSCGNSRMPFLIILVSSILHAVLDVVLVGVCQLELLGAAVSTIFCQTVSAVWCIVYTHRNYAWFRLGRQKLTCSAAAAKTAAGFAWAAALQQAVACLGRFLTQGMLNTLGSETVTGFNMGMRVEAFAFCFSQGLCAAMVVCLSQNVGNRDYARVRLFYRRGVAIELILAVVIGIVFYCFPVQLIRLFSNSDAVVNAGAGYTKTMAFLYTFAVLGEVIQGFFRGIGRIKLTMIASLLQVILRVTMAHFLVPLWGITGVCASVVTGWFLLVTVEGLYSVFAAKKLSVTALQRE